ncbi:MAG: hypothetical protein HOC91_15900 [Nitrospinaceae bacterium]|jgi:hypothetical protein|nr:hypothetical protein [Nitrospinaceae bacterium]MBT3434097.1 hypothetical protein [Nitrospinaceae bacterium]MBT3822178.1 hypothetical protein [Nitrospinaceae bacterium]MBT4094634.1 hypothetical protein [Nitrospinaceae bacterium]MBT4431992.1 hypothetical protein [Nitrospinaceae bacterium]
MASERPVDEKVLGNHLIGSGNKPFSLLAGTELTNRMVLMDIFSNNFARSFPGNISFSPSQIHWKLDSFFD